VALGGSFGIGRYGDGMQDYNWVSGELLRWRSIRRWHGKHVLLGGAMEGLEVDERGSLSVNPGSVTWQALMDDQPTLAVVRLLCSREQRCDSVGQGDEQFERFLLRVGNSALADGGSTWTQITARDGQAFLEWGSARCFQYVESNLRWRYGGDNGLYVGWRRMGIRRRGLYFRRMACDLNRAILSDGRFRHRLRR